VPLGARCRVLHGRATLVRLEGVCQGGADADDQPRSVSAPRLATSPFAAPRLRWWHEFGLRFARIVALMQIPEREAMARAIVDGNSYMTLGTADADGVPWASPVWYAPASYREFFWVSKPGARHSQNIGVRPDIAIVIFDSTVPIGTGKAVYMSARAEEVTAAGEVERGMAVFSARSVAQGGLEWMAADVGASARLRLFRALASEQFVLSPQDERLPFSLE
jgi:hypothetical protein